MRQIKCKKCKLTYPSNKKECPFCHAKRVTAVPAVLIIILLLAVGGVTYYFKGNDIMASLPFDMNNGSKNAIDGIKFTPLETVKEDDEDRQKVTITFEAVNTNNYDIKLDYELTTYVDGYLTDQYYSYDDFLKWSLTSIDDEITANHKCKYTYCLNTPKDWQKIEVFCRRTEENSFFDLNTDKDNSIATDKENQNVIVMTLKND